MIINVGTAALTARAAHSARRFGARDLLLLDCNPTAQSRELMQGLARDVGALYVEAALRRHAEMLDLLLSNLRDESVFLLDSDAELRSDVLNRMRRELQASDVYGSGWIHGACWLPGVFGDGSRRSTRTGWYLERPWIPCTLLKRAPVADALAHGASFREGVIPNDLPRLRLLNRAMLGRFLIPGLRRLRLTPLAGGRREFEGVRPNYCYADTGAVLHHALAARGLRFSGPYAPEADQAEVAHHHGATRVALGAPAAVSGYGPRGRGTATR